MNLCTRILRTNKVDCFLNESLSHLLAKKLQNQLKFVIIYSIDSTYHKCDSAIMSLINLDDYDQVLNNFKFILTINCIVLI